MIIVTIPACAASPTLSLAWMTKMYCLVADSKSTLSVNMISPVSELIRNLPPSPLWILYLIVPTESLSVVIILYTEVPIDVASEILIVLGVFWNTGRWLSVSSIEIFTKAAL